MSKLNVAREEAIARHYARQQEGLPPLPPGYKTHSWRLRTAHQDWSSEREPGYMQHALTHPRTSPSCASEYDAFLEERAAAKPAGPSDDQLLLPLA
jgi:hypothetical protein